MAISFNFSGKTHMLQTEGQEKLHHRALQKNKGKLTNGCIRFFPIGY